MVSGLNNEINEWEKIFSIERLGFVCELEQFFNVCAMSLVIGESELII